MVLEERVPGDCRTPREASWNSRSASSSRASRGSWTCTLTAAEAGQDCQHLAVRGDANLHVEEQIEIEVIAPALEVGHERPRRRYLERQATYTVSVSNPGTAPARTWSW